MVEPAKKQLGTGNSLIAKSLICVKGIIPLRVVNFDNKKVNIYPGINIANLSFVESVQPVIKKQGIPCSSEVPSHLQELYEITAQGLTQEQCKEIAKPLTKHQASFSKPGSDLSRTGIIKPKIPTGDASPIKQPSADYQSICMKRSTHKLMICCRRMLYNLPLAHGLVG